MYPHSQKYSLSTALRFLLPILFCLLIGYSFAQPIPVWHCRGPYGGQVTDIQVDPETNDYFAQIYGLYRMHSGDTLWNEISFPNFRYSCYLIDTTNHCYLIWGSRTNYPINYLEWPSLHKSTNHGASWDTVHLVTSPAWFEKLAVNPSNGDYFGISDSAQIGRIYRSNDHGSNWSMVYIEPGQSLHNITIDNSGTVYVGAFTGLLKSTNNGVSWLYDSVATGEWVHFTARSANCFVIGTNSGNIYRMSNWNGVWQLYGSYPGSGVFAIGIDRNEVVYVSSGNNLGRRSSTSWQSIPEPYNSSIGASQVHALALDTANNVLAGTIAGVHKSTTQGNSWQQEINGLSGAQIDIVAEDLTGRIFAGQSGMGIFQTSDRGETWSNGVVSGISPCNFLFEDSVHAYMTSYEGVFSRSTNNGATWITTIPGTDQWYVCIQKDIDGSLVMDSYQGLLRSTDHGVNWSMVNPRNSRIHGFRTINSRGYYFGYNELGFIWSTDHGQLWNLNQYVNGPEGSWNGDDIRAFYIGPTDRMYLSQGGSLPIFSYDSTFSTWTAIVTPWLGHSRCIQAVAESRTGLLAMGDQYDLIIKQFSDTSWNYLFHDPSGISSLIFTTENYLYISTFSNGIFRSEFPVTNIHDVKIVSIPTSMILSQNYPNPFNSTTTISFSLPKPGTVKLSVFDVTGRKIKTLLNAYRAAGTYRVPFDGFHLSSGMYFYRLETGKNTITQRMTIIK